VVHHRRGLRRLLDDDGLLRSIEEDWRTAGLDERRYAMLEYAVKLTISPADVTVADLNMLRDVGFSERDLLDICEVTAYYAYVNRIADGLGVKLEDWFRDDE
jgi:uncharacterized peroxidase-related enzyme